MITTGIIVAAGLGRRMNSKIEKQFLEVHEKPLVYYALKAFEQSRIDQVILVTGEESLEFCREEIVDRYGFSKVTKIVAGGKERYNSVYNGLRAAEGSDYVLIHDGARPMVTPEHINEMICAVQVEKACTSGMPSKDTIKVTDHDGYVQSTPDRRTLWVVHTPQAFSYSLIREAHEAFQKDGCPEGITDDGMLVENYTDHPMRMIKGSYANMKVTTPDDLPLAEILLADR